MIKVLELQHFGKFHNRRIEVRDGLNLFEGPNEKGKSTIQAFILAMFYGFSRDSTKVRRYSEDYDKYLPLEGGYFQGAIEFSLEHVDYRMKRNFLKNNESCRVINLTTSTQMDSHPSWYKYSRIPQPGVYFFKMNQNHFKNFFLLDDLAAFDLAEVESQIREQLMNLKDTGDEKISLSKAETYLQDQMTEIGTERAKKTPLGQTVRKIAETEARLQEIKEINHRYQSLLEEDQRYAAKISEISSALEPLEDRIDLDIVDDGLKDDQAYRSTRIKLLELTEQKRMLVQKVDELESKAPSLLDQRSSSRVVPVAGVIVILLFILSYTLLSMKFAFPILVVGFIGIYVFSYRENKIRKVYQEQLNGLDHLIYQERELISSCAICSNDMEGEECIQAIDAYFSHRHHGDRLVFDKINQLKSEIHELELSQSKLRYELDDLERMRVEQGELDIKLSQLNEARETYQRRLKSIDKTVEILNLLSKKHAGDGYESFEDSLNSIFSKLTDGKYLRVYFGEDGDIFVQSKSQVLPLHQLSRGTKDQLFLSIRLALLAQNQTEDVPLVIDDSLVHFDNERLENLLKYLVQQTRQTLLFSAHTRELDIISREGYSAHRVDW